MKNFLRSMLLAVAVVGFVVLAAPTATDASYINSWRFHTPGHVEVDSTMNKGSLTIGAGGGSGTATATVASGAKCTCSEETDVTKLVKCSVTTTTLTATGTTSDVVSYICL